MKTIFIKLAAVSALAVAAPVAAQTANGGYQNNGYQNQNQAYGNSNGNLSVRIDQLRARIQAGVQSGTITRSEAVPLREQLRQLTQRERQLSIGGLTGQERSELQGRIRNLRQQIRTADGGNNGQYGRDDEDRDDRYGNGQYNNGQYNNGQYGNQADRIDRNADGFDDRDLDRDGRWDDDARNGADNGQYEDDYQEPVRRGGLGGVIDNVLGRGGTSGALRVGQRASSGLYALPSQYRDQYRDSSNAYFRTDGRQIYQIDARSQTVVRVYAMNR